MLPSNVHLTGDWEVALTEITYPQKINDGEGEDYSLNLKYLTIKGDDGTITIPSGDMHSLMHADWRMETTIKLPAERLTSVADIIKAIDEHINKITPPPLLKLEYAKDAPGLCVKTQLCNEFTLSPSLGRVLGFSEYLHFPMQTHGDEVCYPGYAMPQLLISAKGLSMYAYCDIIDPVVVGDSKVQLLRTIPFDNGHHTFVRPIYVPVQKKHFDGLEINIMTDTGVPVPFVDGKSVVVLHFRRSSNPLFLPLR